MTCLRCDRAPSCRGLCWACYQRAWRRGVVDEWAAPPNIAGRGGRPSVTVLEDATWLVTHGGYSWDQPRAIAERLGLGVWAYRKALQRARAARSPAA